MSTLPDLSPAATLNEKTRQQSTQSPAALDGKAAANRLSPSPSPASQPPASTRSTFASICIVAACTSAQMTSIGLGPAFAISVPYVGKDLHIQKEDLQWILNAYSISSVSNLILTVPVRKCSLLALRTGMFPSSLWAISGPLRSQTTVAYWVLNFGGVWYCSWLRSMYVQFRRVWCRDMSYSRIDTTAAKALDTLRGLQGIGSAAVIPASVSIFLVVCSHTLTFGGLPLAWNSDEGIPPRTLTFHRLCHFHCGRPDRSNLCYCPW
jgi:hypothetical protein